MKNTTRKFSLLTLSLAIVLIAASTMPAQRGAIKTDTRMIYHNGPVMPGTSSLYFIWYGNWSNQPAPWILADLASAVGGSPYFLINTTYPDANGNAPSGGLLYAGSVSDSFSQGPTLTVDNIKQIVEDQISSGALPLDTAGIYIVASSPDVVDIQPDGTSFCTPGASPHHGTGIYSGSRYKYGYLGGASRCPTSAGPQFVAADGSLLPTPNGDFAADAMASSFLHLLNVIVTNPLGHSGWYDRYGFENADKCMGKFGTTFTTANGARANVELSGRQFLIQQNWINERRGRCAVSIAQ